MKIAVSACLLGQKVRFDGGHKHDKFITQNLGKYVDFIPFCPEEIAFGTPRESIRLVRDGENMMVISNKNTKNVTKELEKTSQTELLKLENEEICGIIFKSKSPSCGMGSAKIYKEDGYGDGKGDGIFALLCKNRFALLPMEEEGRLEDAWLRENFIMQIFLYNNFEKFKKNAKKMVDLVDFHTKNKFLLQSKNEILYRELGNIVANREKFTFEEVLRSYEFGFKSALICKNSIKKTVNVLQHMAGFFKKELTRDEKEALEYAIKDFKNKISPLIVPLSLIDLYVKKYAIEYLKMQTFLNPYPKDLALRSHLEAHK